MPLLRYICGMKPLRALLISSTACLKPITNRLLIFSSFTTNLTIQCFPLLKPYNKHKLQNRSMPCVFICYGVSQKGYKCLHVETNRIFLSRHVIFDESVFPLQLSADAPRTRPPLASSSNISSCLPLLIPNTASSDPIPNNTSTVSISPSSNSSNSAQFSSPNQATHSPTNRPEPLTCAAPSPQLINPDPASTLPTPSPTRSPAPVASSHHMVTRTRDHTRKPRAFPNHVALLSNSSNITEPLTFNQAQPSPHWRAAMAQEIDTLAKNQTWILVPPPPNQNKIGCKWVYKLKHHPDG